MSDWWRASQRYMEVERRANPLLSAELLLTAIHVALDLHVGLHLGVDPRLLLALQLEDLAEILQRLLRTDDLLLDLFHLLPNLLRLEILILLVDFVLLRVRQLVLLVFLLLTNGLERLSVVRTLKDGVEALLQLPTLASPPSSKHTSERGQFASSW